MDFVTLFEKFGLPIAFLAVMIYLFLKSEEKNESARKDHRSERKEWKDGQEKLQEGTNGALRELTKAIIILGRKNQIKSPLHCSQSPSIFKSSPTRPSLVNFLSSFLQYQGPMLSFFC